MSANQRAVMKKNKINRVIGSVSAGYLPHYKTAQGDIPETPDYYVNRGQRRYIAKKLRQANKQATKQSILKNRA